MIEVVHSPEGADALFVRLPAVVVNRFDRRAVRLEAHGDHVLAVHFPAYQGAIWFLGPPLVKVGLGRFYAPQGQAHFRTGPPVAADQPTDISNVQRLVQAQLFSEGLHLLRRGELAEQVPGNVTWRDFGDQKDGYGDDEHS